VKLLEISITPFAMNPEAEVTSVKSDVDAVAQFRRMMEACTREIRGK
jgi:hypothetical protein